MEFMENGLSPDPFQINKWGSTQKIQWHNVRVAFSPATGFSLRHCPDNPNPSVGPFERVRLWKDFNVASSSSRPSSGSSTSSFQSRSSQQSALILSETELRESDLLKIPYDLVLCEGYIFDYAEEKDVSFLEVLTWMEKRYSEVILRGLNGKLLLTWRQHAALKYKMTAFLCMAYARSEIIRKGLHSHITSPSYYNPWFDYVAFLPRFPDGDGASTTAGANKTAPLTVPTVWTEEEREYLAGTSLEVGCYF